ncbi:MAG: sodium:solute symporter [Bacteroidales bacterium]|nr:sodium:solute symporter [Bacteroidales bacterium]MCF8343428.1 sodium:solute symporter [Bacteroidales bacterium]MCF8349883.1 sodium:solute symporter [Bacteroidales bacterium]MCF8376764.1 sodium:solute symporter [Bacteroidales bacterium]
MSPSSILTVFLAYSALLFVIAFITSRKATNETFFLGNRLSPWFVVAYGMIGASLSGVTFISVPGWVGDTAFSYMMIVFGYVLGYAVISLILLPLYYKLRLTSIYGYLEQRFGISSYKTGAFYFLVSRIIGASFRMFLMVSVLQYFVFGQWGIPFGLTVTIFMILINFYTFKGGIRTIVWTDTLQTTFMLLAVILSITIILNHLDVSLGEMISTVADSSLSKIVFTDVNHSKFFLKQFLSGAFITIVMTGLDQDMMQKNLSCKTLGDSQKNMMTLSIVLIIVNLMFLFLGAALLIYASNMNISLPDMSDQIFPTIALEYLGPVAGIVFIIGLISAAYSSADSALTALTTSFTVDLLRIEKRDDLSEKEKIRLRYKVHFSIAVVLIIVIVLFRLINDEAVISSLFTAAGYTYGPLLGLFAFGLFTRFKVKDRLIPLVAILSPLLTWLLKIGLESWWEGYKVGYELLLINGLLTFIGCVLLIKKQR